jgi:putative DNA methylase
MSTTVTPFSLKDAPALIEQVLPVQKLCAEAYKEQMANMGKTLTALGSYWKGRKPLILNRACILGCLLPATSDLKHDLEIFEKLMAMDEESFVVRWPRRFKPKDILAKLSIGGLSDYFTAEPSGVLPESAPVDWSKPEYNDVKVVWREDLSELERRRLEVQMLNLQEITYRKRVDMAKRPEEVLDTIHDHIWEAVNAHLGTSAQSFPELVKQLGIMRFGHRPRVADTFCGSGQIPFEAARLGCDVYASDLNPVACMLTWGAFHIVGGSRESREKLAKNQQALVCWLQAEIDKLGVEIDGHGWRGRAYLYCVEAQCPSTGWMVPLMPSRVVSTDDAAIAELVPDPVAKRYKIQIRTGVSKAEMEAAKKGTVVREGKYGEAYMVHKVDGLDYKTKISTLRGDYQKPDGTIGNHLRLWEKLDFVPRGEDLLQERLYCIQWMRPKKNRKGDEYEFRSVTEDDLRRECAIQDYVANHLADWQIMGWVPDMRIEVGGPPRYQGLDLVRARGWTHWSHLFNARQLLVNALLNSRSDALLKLSFANVVQHNSKLSMWDSSGGGRAGVKGVFYNQALNTLYNYGARGTRYVTQLVVRDYKSYPLLSNCRQIVDATPSDQMSEAQDVYVTDPPYGDAVKFEEILDFFIAWLRKNPPAEFANWVWDSRRSLAIKGEGEDFRRGMVAAYKRMTECMPDNGIQIIMFTHQNGAIWGDMANIVWASGLQVTAAWYVATETDSALRAGSHVKGTVLLVCRKRQGSLKTTRDDLAWELQEEVESQVQALTGLNQQAKGLYRDENVFEDADLQMAGYAAALRVLTRYAIIDGRDMTAEAIRPRVKSETTFVDDLIDFAVDTANQCLIPQGIPKTHWDRLTGVERFYLKLIDLESKGRKTLDNYQNFAKAFKVRDFHALMASQKANQARLKSAVEFGKTEMSDSSELHQSVLRAVLYAMMELVKNVDVDQMLAHLTFNVPNYYGDMSQRQLIIDLCDYLAQNLETIRPDEASAARILRELVKNQRL